MESFEELRRMCQKPDYRTKGNWMVRYITRDQALYVTWLLLHTPITANQVTVLSILMGCGAAALFALGGIWHCFAGAIALQVWYLLDHVDGQIARYRKESSLTGVFLDYISHYIVNAAFFACVSFGVYRQGNLGPVTAFIFGFIATVSVVLISLLADCRHKAFFYALVRGQEFNVIRNVDQLDEEKQETRRRLSSARAAFALLHKLCEFHVVMNLVSLLAILHLVLGLARGTSSGVIAGFLIFYGGMMPVVWIARLTHAVLTKSIDEEFEGVFRPSESSES